MERIIYKATNKNNNKSYIGKTIQTLKSRKYAHENSAKLGKNSYFNRAIRKYGRDTFDWFIISIVSSKEELNDAEIMWIARLETFTNRDKGYNATPGGDGSGEGVNNPNWNFNPSLRLLRRRQRNTDKIMGTYAPSYKRGSNSPNWNSNPTPQQLRARKRKAAKRIGTWMPQIGVNNHNWKGDNVKPYGLKRRQRRVHEKIL